MGSRRIRRIHSFCISLIMLLALLPAGASAAELIASGTCGGEGDGSNLTWTLDSDGVLKISGTGPMPDWKSFSMEAPWYSRNDWILSVEIGDGVTYIGSCSFRLCYSLRSVNIPDSVTGISESAFVSCNGLTQISVASGNPNYCSEDDVLFNKDKTVLMLCPRRKSGAYSIPDSVTIISDSAFQECVYLTGITIPDSVISIGKYAFEGCDSLTSVTIPDSVTSIGFGAIRLCKNLTSIAIPDSVISIGENAFASCVALAQINVASGNPNYCSEDDVLFNKEKTVLIQCPGRKSGAYSIPDSVTIIGKEAFRKCVYLTGITIPDSVTSIGSRAFSCCNGLRSVTIPNSVISIGFSAFGACENLTSIAIPDSVTSIGEYAFDNCDSLTDIYYGGHEAQWQALDIQDHNDPLLNATIHFNSDGTDMRTSEEHTLPTATQYVPYQEAILASLGGGSFALTTGALPEGLSLNASGVISGIPRELGVFSFTVTETYAGGSTEHECTIAVYSRMYADVEANNIPGYGFVETETDNGRVQDQVVTSAAELTDQVMHLQGTYSEFRNLYIDARQLIRGVEYTAEEGSTKITIYAETIGEEGGGTHTIAAEFETDSGETIYTVQNYTVAGIASTEVHVTVSGETVIWTDAEPYIDTNSRTVTPFRVVGDALALTIAWDSATREASFSDGQKTIYFPIGSTTARTSEGTTVEMDTSAVIVNGRTYAPVRYLAEYFGYTVEWDAPTRTVIVK